MKISLIASAFLCLSSPFASAQSCDGRKKEVVYGSSNNALAQSSSDGGFTAPSSGDFICKISCDKGENINLYVKYSTSGTAGPNNNDVALEGGSCGDEVESQNTEGKAGIKIYMEADAGYENLKLTCECRDQAGGGGGCFSGDDFVQVLGQGQMLMKDLKVGDKVLTGDKYEPVYSFGHYHETHVRDFVTLETGTKDPLSMTHDHLIYVNDQYSPVRADHVQVGDNLSSGKVEKVVIEPKEGLFMPLTPSGKIMVNDVEASSYVSMSEYAPIQQHPLLKFWLSENFLVHLWLAPYRLYCMGVSSNYCHDYPKNVDGDEGIMGYLLMGKKVAEFAMNQNLFVQILVGVPLFGSLLAVHAVETLAGGPSLAPLVVLFALGAWMKFREAKAKKQKIV